MNYCKVRRVNEREREVTKKTEKEEEPRKWGMKGIRCKKKGHKINGFLEKIILVTEKK